MNGLVDLFKAFEVDEASDPVAFCEALGEFQFMFRDSANEIVGHADVDRTSDFAGQNVDIIGACTHLPPLEYWIARSSRAMTARLTITPPPAACGPGTVRGRLASPAAGPRQGRQSWRNRVPRSGLRAFRSCRRRSGSA